MVCHVTLQCLTMPHQGMSDLRQDGCIQWSPVLQGM